MKCPTCGGLLPNGYMNHYCHLPEPPPEPRILTGLFWGCLLSLPVWALLYWFLCG